MLNLAVTILKHFHPIKWLTQMSEEAKQIPATVTGIFFLTIALAASLFLGLARSEELTSKVSTLQNVVSTNTTELKCSKKDRRIAAKIREIDTATRLMLRSDDDNEVRELKAQITELERELKNMESTYSDNCLGDS